MLELARAAHLAGRAERALAGSAKLLDQAAALSPGTAQNSLFSEAVRTVNKTTIESLGFYPFAKQSFGAATRLAKAAEFTGVAGLGSVSSRLDEAAASAKGVRFLETAERYPEIHFTGPMLGPERSLDDARGSAKTTLEQLRAVMPELRTAARGQQLVIAGVGGAAALGAVGGTAYLVTR